jgi:geranylgeranyl reductase family protein
VVVGVVTASSIGIVGAGISGTYLAYLLGRLGRDVILFDPRVPWEKPCGGGITCRTYNSFPILNGFRTGSLSVHKMRMFSAQGECISVPYPDPMMIVSRKLLGEYLLNKAEAEGVRLIKQRVRKITAHGSTWRLQAGEDGYDCQALVGADGVHSLVRRSVYKGFPKEDTTFSVGYWVEGGLEEDEVVIAFLPGISGYIWIFPRKGHVSAGIGARIGEATGKELYARLDGFLQSYFPALMEKERTPYSALIPSLSGKSFVSNRVCDGNWALIGDAAGWVDPLTGEGIYYAFRSAELLSDAFSTGAIGEYEKACREEMVPELSRASSFVQAFFDPRVSNRLVSLSKEQPAIRSLLVNLIAGNQGYLSLKNELLKVLPVVVRDTLFRFFRND